MAKNKEKPTDRTKKPSELEEFTQEEIYELALEAKKVRDIPDRVDKYLSQARVIAKSDLANGCVHMKKGVLLGHATFGKFKLDLGMTVHEGSSYNDQWGGDDHYCNVYQNSDATLTYEHQTVVSDGFRSKKVILDESEEWVDSLDKLYHVALNM